MEIKDAPTLETKRLILRKWTYDDAPSMFKYASDPDVGPRAGWPPHKTVDDSITIISHFLDHHPYCYAICLKDDVAHPIGSVELKTKTDLTDKDDELELGYWLGKPFWGNGYMPEAARAVLKFGFETLGLSAVWCGFYDGNLKSRRVQEKLGFVYHHTSQNVPVPALDETRTGHVSLLTRENWSKQKNIF